MAFELDTVIPSASNSHGLISYENLLLFTSSNTIYQVKQDKIFFLLSLHGEIQDLQIYNDLFFAKTDKMLYMCKNDKILATMRMKSSFCFSLCDSNIFISTDKNIAQFKIPQEFKPLPFEKVSEVKAHTNETIKMKSLQKENMVLSIGEDCTVRISSGDLKISKQLFYFTDEPVDLFYEEIIESPILEVNNRQETQNHSSEKCFDENFTAETGNSDNSEQQNTEKGKTAEDSQTKRQKKDFQNSTTTKINLLDNLKAHYIITGVSSSGCFIQFCTKKRQIITQKYLYEPICAATNRKSTYFFLTEQKTVIVLNKEAAVLRNEKLVSFKLEKQGNEISCNQNDIFVKGENFLERYSCTDQKIDNLIFKIQSEDTKDEVDSLLLLNSISLPKIVDFSYSENLAVASEDQKVILYKIGSNYLQIMNIFDVEEPIFQVFYKKNTILVLTETSQVKAFDLTNFVKFRDINLEYQVRSADTNDDNSLMIFGDNSHIYILDIKTSKILDSILIPAPAMKVQISKNFVFCLLMSNEVMKLDIFTQKCESFGSAQSVFNIFVSNQKVLTTQKKSVHISDISSTDTSKTNSVISCSFRSRSRDEMSISEKPPTAVALSYDERILVCGGRSNQIRVIDTSTGLILKNIKLSRNKELENYKVKLGKEKTSEFSDSNVIEALKIEYIPNGFIIFSREGIFIYKIPFLRIKPVLESVISSETTQSLINEQKWSEALQSATNHHNLEALSQIISKTPQSEVDQLVKTCPQINQLKEMINALLIDTFDLNLVFWLNRLVFYHSGTLVENDIQVIRLLKEKI